MSHLLMCAGGCGTVLDACYCSGHREDHALEGVMCVECDLPACEHELDPDSCPFCHPYPEVPGPESDWLA